MLMSLAGIQKTHFGKGVGNRTNGSVELILAIISPIYAALTCLWLVKPDIDEMTMTLGSGALRRSGTKAVVVK